MDVEHSESVLIQGNAGQGGDGAIVIDSDEEEHQYGEEDNQQKENEYDINEAASYT